MTLLQYVIVLEDDRGKLKAQVRRIAEENGWLRQELQRHTNLLMETESELCRVKEDKQHLEYLLATPKVGGGRESIIMDIVG